MVSFLGHVGRKGTDCGDFYAENVVQQEKIQKIEGNTSGSETPGITVVIPISFAVKDLTFCGIHRKGAKCAFATLHGQWAVREAARNSGKWCLEGCVFYPDW